MNRSKGLVLAAVVTVVACTPSADSHGASRSARPAPAAASKPVRDRFSRDASAALFVGVRTFTHRELASVPYAADDAVDLAYLFAFNRRVRLVRADRIVLALSGKPEKPESQRKLTALRNAGARIKPAEASDILLLLRKQAALAGKDGIFIVSIATHGFLSHGVPYILGASSRVHQPETTLSMAEILDVAARSGAARSLVFVDACRERIGPATRSVVRETDTAAPLFRTMGHTHGQAIFFAASPGQYAYDDHVHHNGVFTQAVIDGLSCKAATSRGLVTASTLATHVENSVVKWIRANIDENVRSATQSSIDGDARKMPLSQCWCTCPDPSVCGVARVSAKGSVLHAFKSDGSQLWQIISKERIQKATVEDLDADGSNEVVLSTRRGISAYDTEKKELWSANEGMPLRALAVDDLFRKHTREVVALWRNDHSSTSRLSVFSAEGQRLSSIDYPGRLDLLAVGRPTNHHAPKIIVGGKGADGESRVLAFDPKKVARGKPLWSGQLAPHREISAIEVADDDRNGSRDICITTAGGDILVLDFRGKVVARHAKHGSGASLQFHLLHSHRTRP